MGENFTAPTPRLIESSDGFSVEELTRTRLLYREGGRSAHVYYEYNAPGASALMTIWRGDSIRKWDAPHDADEMTDSDKDRIIGNVCRAYAAKGYGIDVI
jgi:hypothetical protein